LLHARSAGDRVFCSPLVILYVVVCARILPCCALSLLGGSFLSDDRVPPLLSSSRLSLFLPAIALHVCNLLCDSGYDKKKNTTNCPAGCCSALLRILCPRATSRCLPFGTPRPLPFFSRVLSRGPLSGFPPARFFAHLCASRATATARL